MDEHTLYELTNPQKSIWLTEQYFNGTTINNICATGTIYGNIDIELLKQSINALIKNNDSFRIHITLDNDVPKQYISDFKDLNIDVEYINDTSILKKIETKEVNTRFEILNNDLFRIKIVVMKDKWTTIILTANHLIIDSWSTGIAIKQILKTYNNLLKSNQKSNAQQNQVQNIKQNQKNNNDTNSYVDYINSELEYKSSKKFENDKKYWEDQFKTIPEQATILGYKRVTKSPSNKAERVNFEIDKKMQEKINNFCKANNFSLANFFMSVFSIYIGRITNLDDFVIGVPILNRTNKKQKETTGMFINTVPVRINKINEGTFKEYLANFSKNMIGILRHQKYSYNTILKDLRAKNPNIPNLYNILISYQITNTSDKKLGNYKAEWIFNNYCANDLNIHISDINDTGVLTISYDYLIDKYSKEDITDMHKRIVNIIDQILNNNEINSIDIDIVTPEEKNKILKVYSNLDVDFPKDKTIVDLFEEQVKKTPNNTAIVFGDKSLTYKELNEKANSLAHFLVKQNIKPKTVVGIRIDKSFEMVIGILAIIKAGCCYLPINMQYPKDRVLYMLQDSDAKILLGTKESLNEFNFNIKSENEEDSKNKNSNIKNQRIFSNKNNNIETLNNIKNEEILNNKNNDIGNKENQSPNIKKIDISLENEEIYKEETTNLKIKISPEDLIYIIYTSGSTGKPKGAMLCHRNVVRLFKNDKFFYDFNEKDVWTMFHSAAFDFSVWEMFGALLFGGKLILVTDEIAKDPELFLDLMRKEQVTILNQTPTYFYKLQQAELNRNDSNLKLRYIIFGGEALTPLYLKDWHTKYPKTKLVNMYGITEGTVHVSFKELTENDIDSTESNIGVPLPTMNMLILDKNQKLLPFGQIGELVFTGDGIFKGYLHREDLNKTKLLKIPEYSNKIIYRSGDTAIMHKDGHFEYMGRIDNQVKIRGFRVELGEIEEKILKYANISTCIVTKKIDEENRELLCAYYIKNGPINISALRIQLNEHLPAYMVPQYFIEIDKVPINVNGKTDFKALPLPKKAETGVKMVKPRNELDEYLINTYKKYLHIENISMTDSFYDLGGDSLTAISISENICKDLNVNVTVKDILEKNVLIDLSDYISTLSIVNSKDFEILKAKKEKLYPLSSAQKRIYLEHNKIGKDNTVYNIPGMIKFNQHLNLRRVRNVFAKLIERHSSFRTEFVLDGNEVKQKVLRRAKINIESEKFIGFDLSEITRDFVKPFKLDAAPLLRVKLYYLRNNKTIMLIDTHHIIMDGKSLNNLINEFCLAYNKQKLPEKKLSYIDYAVWEENFLKSETAKSMENYWINKFTDFPINELNLPYDFNPKAIQTYKGDKIGQKIDPELFKDLENIAKSLNVSSYVLFLSCFLILLNKYTSQNEIIVGSPIVNRENEELQNLIGMFVNNITITAKIDNNEKFTDFLNEIKKEVFNDIAMQAYPYDKLVKKLNIQPFNVVFTYQNTEDTQIALDGQEAKIKELQTKTSKFAMTLEVRPNENTINLEYMTDLFKFETAQSFMEHYIFILEQIQKNSNIELKDIDIITPKEKEMLAKFNNTAEPTNDDTFASLFEKQVKLHPDNIALICNDKSLTYKELNKKANSLAHYLIDLGVKPNDIVSIMANRSLETIVGMLAITKAGAAFLNLDPTYPEDRTKYYIENSKSEYVLVQKELLNKVSNFKNQICFDLNEKIYNKNFRNPNIKVKPTDLSYIIYTSGSTGTPKGVMLSKIGLANMIKAMYKVLNYLKEGNKHCIVSVTSTPFDIFVYEITVSLAYGLKVVMANNAEHRNPKLLDKLIRKYNVDVMTVTPSLMKINYDNREPNSALAMVKNMVFGGEPLSEKFVADLKSLADDITIYNIYGPSEITVLSNVQNLNNEKEITVGPPIMNTKIHILDKNMKQVPIGVAGEIYISGIQVGLGYINKPELTTSSFLENPFGPGKIYKTGDIGKWTFNGKVQILGRIDNQIKLRGLRIELSEIENRMLEIKGVISAIVNKIELDGKEVLCGYFVAKEKIETSTIKEHLRLNLPAYMIPTYIMQLDEMPYTINRKIDRKSLPIPKLKADTVSNISIAKLDSNEDKLIQIWKNILKVDNITIDDNFFDIGGDSISAIQLQIEAVKYNLEFQYADIFNYPTIRQLAKKLPSPEKSFMKNYDYTKINEILSRNKIENITSIRKYQFKNILLIGGTGFLGSHIIDSFMKNESGDIYCLIRKKDGQNPIERLILDLEFYFGDKYTNEIGNRIKILEGDITLENIGLSKEDYKTVKKNVDAVINAGALVKHYGIKEKFDAINVIGTQNVVDLCLKLHKRLLHISTISVSGFGEKENVIKDDSTKKLEFSEYNLYIGQNLKGIYTTTKFKAEIQILEAISKGLDAQILRIGNITNRYSDGIFQHNIENNAFANRIKTFINIKAFPKYILKHEIELTPVDLCADCIIKILENTSECNVLHLYNPNLLSVELLYKTLTENYNLELVPMSNKMFAYLITGMLEYDDAKDLLSGIIYDLDKNKNLIYTSKIKLDNEFTQKYLKIIGFDWKIIDKNYIIRYIDYFRKIKFIDLK